MSDPKSNFKIVVSVVPILPSISQKKKETLPKTRAAGNDFLGTLLGKEVLGSPPRNPCLQPILEATVRNSQSSCEEQEWKEKEETTREEWKLVLCKSTDTPGRPNGS